MISDALFLAEHPDGLAAGLLLGDQLAPILALFGRSSPKMPRLHPLVEGWITRRLPTSSKRPDVSVWRSWRPHSFTGRISRDVRSGLAIQDEPGHGNSELGKL